MKKNITFTKIYDHPVSKVWDALTSSKALSEWLMDTEDFKAEIGHHFKFTTTPQGSFDGIIHCCVKELIPNKRLVYSWGNGKLDTLVSFQLHEQEGKTVLNFEHSGFESLMERLVVRNMLARGWRKKLLSVMLPQYLSK